MLKIRERIIRKFNRKTGEYDRVVNLFEKYKIGEDRVGAGGYRMIEIIGPKQTFILCSTAKPLTIIKPPLNDGEPAIKIQLPLFFVSPMKTTGKIQGAEYFALDGNELIAYRKAGYGSVEEL